MSIINTMGCCQPLTSAHLECCCWPWCRYRMDACAWAQRHFARDFARNQSLAYLQPSLHQSRKMPLLLVENFRCATRLDAKLGMSLHDDDEFNSNSSQKYLKFSD